MAVKIVAILSPGDMWHAVGRALGAIAVRAAVVTPPAGVKSGWDAADALEEGWDGARTREMIAKAHPVPAATRTVQQSLERIGLNVRWLERNREELAAWFQR